MVRASELAKKFLNIAPPADAPVGVEHTLSIEQREKLARIQGDLVWLVREGYVTEFIDGALYATPPMVESRKREFEASEHDPENFPDARATVVPFTSAAPQPAPALAPAPEPTAGPERTATVEDLSKTDAPPSVEPAKEFEPPAANIPPAELQKTEPPTTTA